MAYIVTTLAGNGIAGYIDGIGTNAEFDTPQGLAVDRQGNVYVGDSKNQRIRKITATGLVTTLAGNGITGFADGNASNAEFNGPIRLFVDTLGNVYVADLINNRIRKISSTGIVTTVAGNGIAGYVDGNAANAEFNWPDGIAFDKSGNMYVPDYNNNRIRKITPAGIVSTIAGNGILGHVDGNAANAEFNGPAGVVLDVQGNIYISDQEGNFIRKLSTSGIVTTFAGNGIAGFMDGIGTNAEFSNPRPIDIDSLGNIYVADFNNNRIRRISNGVLPITLIGFKAQLQKNDIFLSWQTATEENTSYFIILRSTDGIHFQNLDKVSAAGISNIIKNYTYKDANIVSLNANTLFYRLQEVDKDGAITYSTVQTVNFIEVNSLISISPNPSKDFINITSSIDIINAQVRLTDMDGQILYTTKQNLKTGQQLKIGISEFPSGMLILTIENKNDLNQFKIIKE